MSSLSGLDPQYGSLAAHSQLAMVTSRMPLPGNGEARIELSCSVLAAVSAAVGSATTGMRAATEMRAAGSSMSVSRAHTQGFDDVAASRMRMATLIVILKNRGGSAGEVARCEVLLEIIFGHVKASCFASVQGLFKKLECLLLPNPTLFGQVISSDAETVSEMLAGKVGAGLGARLLEPDVKVASAIRLIQAAQCRGWCETLADSIARMAKKVELIDKAAGASSTFEDVCVAFDANTKKADGQPLWSLSKKANANLGTFRNNMTSAMKLKFPASGNATRVLEVADKRGWLERLAQYAAKKMSLEGNGDDGGDDDDMPNMSRR